MYAGLTNLAVALPTSSVDHQIVRGRELLLLRTDARYRESTTSIMAGALPFVRIGCGHQRTLAQTDELGGATHLARRRISSRTTRSISSASAPTGARLARSTCSASSMTLRARREFAPTALHAVESGFAKRSEGLSYSSRCQASFLGHPLEAAAVFAGPPGFSYCLPRHHDVDAETAFSSAR